MYPGKYAQQHPDRACFVMADSGEIVTYAEYEARCNQLAHLLRANGLQRLDHYSIFMENNSRYLETCGAGERAGLHYTAINSHLTAEELAYIVDNSESKALITSSAKRDVALEAVRSCPKLTLFLMVDAPGDDGPFVDYATAIADQPTTPIPDEVLGTPMLYSSGTTGQPKGIIRVLPEQPPGEPMPLFTFLSNAWRYREDMIYLSPAPLYHSAPQAAVGLTVRMGGTAIIMERFDPEQYLQLVEKYRVTHSQLVPTMFSRMLKLPEDVRTKYDLSSLEVVVHAAAPCPIPVKEQMIEWWGPKIIEYYGATEAIGFTMCDSEEWLAHRGTVGKVMLGELHILDDDMNECALGVPGTIWFRTPAPLTYFNAPEKSRDAMSPDGTMATVGDVGYVDADGFLYLTDRKTFMIISGGVNVYPQETENLLITHPKVADAAVFGVPNADLGEEVKAVVQPMPGIEPGPELERELIAFCQEHLARQKCPWSVDFDPELPRLPTGKLYKRVLRDRYWGDQISRIAQQERGVTYTAGRTCYDADSHIMELPDFLRKYADPDVRAEMPDVSYGASLVTDEEVAEIVARGDRHSDEHVAELLALGDHLIEHVKEIQALGAFDGAERSVALDLLGFERQLVFATHSVAMPFSANPGIQPRLRYGAARAHNRHMAEFCGDDPRLMGVAIVPLDVPEQALAEARWAVDAGLAAVWVPHRPCGSRSPGHVAFEPLWSLLAEAGVPFLLHVGGNTLQLDPAWSNTGRGAVKDWMGGGENVRSKDMAVLHHGPETFVSIMVMDGVLERHPTLRGAAIELGAGWVPALLSRLDYVAKTWGKVDPMLQSFTRRPSEQLAEQFAFTPYVFEDVGALVDQSSADLYLFSSDYPHTEGGRNPIARFESSLGDRDDIVRRKFYAENFLRIFPELAPA